MTRITFIIISLFVFGITLVVTTLWPMAVWIAGDFTGYHAEYLR